MAPHRPAPHRPRHRRSQRASRASGADAPGARLTNWPVETPGFATSYAPAGVVSTLPPKTENPFTQYRKSVAAGAWRPRSSTVVGKRAVDPFIGASATNASTISPVVALIVKEPNRPSELPVNTAPRSAPTT